MSDESPRRSTRASIPPVRFGEALRGESRTARPSATPPRAATQQPSEAQPPRASFTSTNQIMADKAAVMDTLFKGFESGSIDEYLGVFELRCDDDAGAKKKQLLRCLSQDVLQQLLLIEANLKSKTFTEIAAILKAQFAGGASSQAAAMEKLKRLQQKEGQSAREFAAELAKLASAAKVTTEDQRIAHFLAGVNPDVLRSYGASKHESLALTVEAIQLIQDRLTMSNSVRSSSTASTASTAAVSSMNRQRYSKSPGPPQSRGRSSTPFRGRQRSQSRERAPKTKFSGTCFGCGKVGHKQAECRLKIATVVGAVQGNLFVEAKCLGKECTFMLDTGSQFTLMTTAKAKELGASLMKCNVSAKVASTAQMPFDGKFIANIEVDGITEPVTFFVTKKLVFDFIAGLDFMSKFGIITNAKEGQIILQSGKVFSMEAGRLKEVTSSAVQNEANPVTNEVTLSTQIGEAIELTETQKAKAASIMDKYPELFSSEVNKMRLVNVARMPIKIQRGAKPGLGFFKLY